VPYNRGAGVERKSAVSEGKGMRGFISVAAALSLGAGAAIWLPSALASCIIVTIVPHPQHQTNTGIAYCHIEPDIYWQCTSWDDETAYNDCVSGGPGDQYCLVDGHADITSHIMKCGNAVNVCDDTTHQNAGHFNYTVHDCE
jgi:hypothetical protein